MAGQRRPRREGAWRDGDPTRRRATPTPTPTFVAAVRCGRDRGRTRAATCPWPWSTALTLDRGRRTRRSGDVSCARRAAGFGRCGCLGPRKASPPTQRGRQATSPTPIVPAPFGLPFGRLPPLTRRERTPGAPPNAVPYHFTVPPARHRAPGHRPPPRAITGLWPRPRPKQNGWSPPDIHDIHLRATVARSARMMGRWGLLAGHRAGLLARLAARVFATHARPVRGSKWASAVW